MWQGILGHDAVVEQFRRSMAHGRLASSFLFLGPHGVGKRTFALKLAQALFCQEHGTGDLNPCGTCESCLLWAAGNHPDLDVVQLPEDKRSLPVELFIGDREHRNHEGLCHNISLKPMLGRRRVAIIDDADHLGIEAANCLLKTLEEPPPGAVLILLATSRGRLLPTIISRTQLVRFAPLDETALALLIEAKQIAPGDQAAALASLSRGSLARARELADSVWLEFYRWLPSQLAAGRGNATQLAERVTEFVNQAGSSADARRQRLRAVFHLAAEHFRALLYEGCQGELLQTGAMSPAAAQARELGPFAQHCALAALDCTLQAEVDLDRNANQATLIECWLDELASALRRPKTTFAL